MKKPVWDANSTLPCPVRECSSSMTGKDGYEMMFLQRLSLGMFGWRCSFFEPFLLACLLGWVVWRIKRWYTALAGDDWMACMTFLTFFSLSLFFFSFCSCELLCFALRCLLWLRCPALMFDILSSCTSYETSSVRIVRPPCLDSIITKYLL